MSTQQNKKIILVHEGFWNFSIILERSLVHFGCTKIFWNTRHCKVKLHGGKSAIEFFKNMKNLEKLRIRMLCRRLYQNNLTLSEQNKNGLSRIRKEKQNKSCIRDVRNTPSYHWRQERHITTVTGVLLKSTPLGNYASMGC
jgi:hypothetical protein